MKVFSLKKYGEWCKKESEPIYDWATDCEGLTESEMIKKGYVTIPKWMVGRKGKK